MIWLASFPRSGNTFFRNILFEVYGIKSSAYHKDEKRTLNKQYASFELVKTHLLPAHLPAEFQNKKSVYIIRDGRDCLVSIAHHRKDITEKGSPFYNNLLEAILAAEGSYFGGWSENVKQWTEKADIVIRFEDLIKNPIKEVEKLRSIFDLPNPDISKLPNFKVLKFGKPKYGGNTALKHFRKGKIGGWKDDLPPELHRLFWDLNSKEMLENNFTDTVLPIRANWKTNLNYLNLKKQSLILRFGRKFGL